MFLKNLTEILYNTKGDFQWASIAALVSFMAAIISIWGTKRNISANLKAKARIEWIQKARIISAELITNAFKFNTLTKNYLNLTKRINSIRNGKKEELEKRLLASLIEKRSETFKELQESFDSVYEKQVLFKLYFGPNEENNKIVNQSLAVREAAEIIWESIINYRFNLDKKKGIELYSILEEYEKGSGSLKRTENTGIEIKEITNKEFKKQIEAFSDQSREYYKKEWDIAKKGK